MYNMFPVFTALSQSEKYRKELLDKCYFAFRMTENDYSWMDCLAPSNGLDELKLALKGDPDEGIKVPSVNDWYATRD